VSIHDGHRERKRKQFLEHGLDAFADHEVLELLLFYAVRQGDTNPTAHELMRRFGSLNGVLTASPEELLKVKGVGEHTAALLSLIYPLVRRARTGDGAEPVIFNSTQAVDDYFTDLFLGLREERLYEACLDAKCKLLRCVPVADGCVDTVSLNVRRLVENAISCGASFVVLAHNHPSGLALPSEDDNAATLLAWNALRAVGVELIDHVIVADGDYVSLRDNGLLPPR